MDLTRPRERADAEEFLKANDLRLEPLDTAFCVRNPQKKMIGFGGRAKDVLKCFAFADAYRGQALLNPLITELITDAFHAGVEDLLIYTKADYLPLFLQFGFREVAHTDTVALLHRGAHTPEATMDALQLQTDPRSTTGAIVMNANPFTLGHRVLVEHAAQKSDRLLVFVVEQEASFFSFADRFQLVQEGVKDLSNVVVLPSTRYLISASTFPSYFLKDEEIGDQEHAKLDAAVFARWFVPRFAIQKRFVGEEPADPTTANYNTALLETLPPACEVEVIPRKRIGDTVISASTVRACLKTGDWDRIQTLVPETTYRYLREHHA